jgi:hypothetical protein
VARERRARASRIALGVLVVAAPAVVTYALLATLFHATLFDYFPLVSDEIAYQRQIAAFVQAGFDGGYFNTYERPALLGFTHFSVHGPAFPVIYGLIGRVVGWELYSGPIFNLAVLALATAAFLVMGRLSRVQIVATGAVILTSWWVILMATITMQESLNQAVMIVMAGFAARLMHPDTRRHGWLLIGALTILAAASVLRPTNWIVAVPLVLVGTTWQRPLRVVVATLAAGLGIPLFWLIWRYLSAPIPGLAIDFAPATGSGAVGMIASFFFNQLEENVEDVFGVTQFLEAPFLQHVMFESAALASACAVLTARECRRVWAARAEGPSRILATPPAFKVDLFNLLALGLALLAFLGFYFDSEASISRVMAPFLLLSLLVLVATRFRTWMIVCAVAASLLVTPSFLAFYRAWRIDLFRNDTSRYQLFRTQLMPWLTYDARRTPWCNTLLTMTFEREIIAVPAGVGLSVGNPPDNVTAPIKSGYLLLRPDGVEAFARKTRLEHLATTALGELYANRDAKCD